MTTFGYLPELQTQYYPNSRDSVIDTTMSPPIFSEPAYNIPIFSESAYNIPVYATNDYVTDKNYYVNTFNAPTQSLIEQPVTPVVNEESTGLTATQKRLAGIGLIVLLCVAIIAFVLFLNDYIERHKLRG